MDRQRENEMKSMEKRKDPEIIQNFGNSPQSMTCYAVASPPSSPWCNCTICVRTSVIAYGSCTDCSNADIWPTMSVASPAHLLLLWPHPRHIDCNCTMMNRAVPMSPNTPNKSHVCNFDFCKPCDCIHHPFQLWHYIWGIPWCWPLSNLMFPNRHHIF